MADESLKPEPTTTRAVHLALAAIIALAFVGFFVGIRQGTPVPDLEPRERIAAEELPGAVPAMSYLEFDRRQYGPNAEWRSILTDLDQPQIDWFGEPERTEAGRQLVLAARAERRAFDGAPPTVPHPIDQMSAASCMACHRDGISIGRGVRATPMSHEFMPNCTQCHVEQSAPALGSFTFRDNTFEPVESAVGGERAWPGAPPTVPHTTFMRENCLSCHGPQGPDPIRTTHPWQTNCLQCHAPSAVFDQVVIEDRPSLLADLDGG